MPNSRNKPNAGGTAATVVFIMPRFGANHAEQVRSGSLLAEDSVGSLLAEGDWVALRRPGHAVRPTHSRRMAAPEAGVVSAMVSALDHVRGVRGASLAVALVNGPTRRCALADVVPLFGSASAPPKAELTPGDWVRLLVKPGVTPTVGQITRVADAGRLCIRLAGGGSTWRPSTEVQPPAQDAPRTTWAYSEPVYPEKLVTPPPVVKPQPNSGA